MKHLTVFAVLIGSLIVAAESKPADQQPEENAKKPNDKAWSRTVNGLQAQMVMKKKEILNETPIISTYLTLRNVSGVGNPMKVKWTNDNLVFRVVDEKGNELPKVLYGDYDGGGGFVADLVLPFDSSLTFNISKSGLGVPRGKAALLDFGPVDNWVIDRADGKKYFLETTLKVPAPPGRPSPSNERYWHGTIHIPKVEIPLTNTAAGGKRSDARPNAAPKGKAK